MNDQCGKQLRYRGIPTPDKDRETFRRYCTNFLVEVDFFKIADFRRRNRKWVNAGD